MPRPEAPCPVCGAAGGRPTCAQCRWVLQEPLQAGPVTAEMRARFAVRLAEARRRQDARIVARIGAEPGPYLAHIRGGVPTEEDWELARRDALADLGAALGEAALRARLTGLLSELPERALIAEVGVEGVGWAAVDLDRFGSPRLRQDARPVAWASLLPGLSADERERHFQLAGRLRPVAEAVIWDRLRRAMPVIADPVTLVICRPAGWLAVETVAALIADRTGAGLLRAAGTADGPPALAVLAQLAALRQGYWLAVAAVDAESGAVRLQTRPLFAPGDESSLPLRGLPGDHEDATLAVFADPDGAGEPVALYTVPRPAGSYRLRASLDGSGRVRILQPDGAGPHPWTWDKVLAAMPDLVEVATGPVDLVCAVDLAGEREVVRARLRLVRELLELAAAEYPEPGWLNATVLTCTDHNFEPGRERRKVVRGRGPGPAGDALAWLGRQRHAAVVYPSAAPVEDMLHVTSQLLSGSRAAGRAAKLLTVAGRHPHPYPQDLFPGDHTLPCPLWYQWPGLLGQLTGSAGARCVAVADSFREDGTPTAIWRAIGPAGVHALPEATARLVGEDLGLLVRPAQRISVPLPNPE